MKEQNSEKRFYRIGDVAEVLGIPASTLRYWEKEFTIIQPRRSSGSVRLYTAKDIETIKMIHYLVKERGLKLDAAQAAIKRNRSGVEKRWEVVERLRLLREQLIQIKTSVDKIAAREGGQMEP